LVAGWNTPRVHLQPKRQVRGVAGGPPTLVHEHPYSDFSPEWSPDGAWIAFPALVSGQDTHVFIVPTAGGDVRRIAGPNGPLDAVWPRWSPDSRRLAFVSRASGKSDVGIYDLESGMITWLADPDWEAYWPDWSPDGQRLAYVLNRDGNFDLALHDLASGERRNLVIEPGIHALPQFVGDADTLSFVYQGAGYPADLWTVSLAGGQPHYRQLTHSLPPRRSRRAVGAAD
jgi:Tol biopolymer transport system component